MTVTSTPSATTDPTRRTRPTGVMTTMPISTATASRRVHLGDDGRERSLSGVLRDGGALNMSRGFPAIAEAFLKPT